MSERTIKRALDRELGEIIVIAEEITSQKEGFALRSKYNDNIERFSCLECEQRLIVSFSRRDNVYFKHLPNADYCVYKDANINQQLIDAYELARSYKESDRHIELKNKIGKLLVKVPGILVSSIDIDTKFIWNGKEKRKPDVFCQFDGKSIAFEIQLSYLPLHYIRDRFRFYREKGIYLIWVLDIKGGEVELNTHQRDLKYDCQHQNLFRLNETVADSLEFICYFKMPYIGDNNTYREKWYQRSISFERLSFNAEDHSVFFFDYLNERDRVKKGIEEIAEARRNEILEKQVSQKKKYADKLVLELKERLKRFVRLDYNLYRFIETIDELDEYEIESLNQLINLNRYSKDNLPLFLHYIKNYQDVSRDSKVTIVELILTCKNLHFDINIKDSIGNGIIQYIFLNRELDRYLYRLLPLIPLRKYKPTADDKKFLIKNYKLGESYWLRLTYYAQCQNSDDVEFVKRNFKYLMFIESAIQMRRIDSNQNSWVKYMMPILSNYKHLWKYTLIVLENTPLGKELVRVDKKNTISKKVIEFKLDEDHENIDDFSMLVNFYPEIMLV